MPGGKTIKRGACGSNEAGNAQDGGRPWRSESAPPSLRPASSAGAAELAAAEPLEEAVVARIAALLLALKADAEVDRQAPGQAGTHPSADAGSPIRAPKKVRGALPAKEPEPGGGSGFGSGPVTGGPLAGDPSAGMVVSSCETVAR